MKAAHCTKTFAYGWFLGTVAQSARGRKAKTQSAEKGATEKESDCFTLLFVAAPPLLGEAAAVAKYCSLRCAQGGRRHVVDGAGDAANA